MVAPPAAAISAARKPAGPPPMIAIFIRSTVMENRGAWQPESSRALNFNREGREVREESKGLPGIRSVLFATFASFAVQILPPPSLPPRLRVLCWRKPDENA